MNSADDLVMEKRPTPASRVEEPAGGMIKNILFVVHEDDGLDARLQAALSLARSCSAHLQLLQVVPLEAFTVVDTYGGTFASGEIVEALQEEAEKVRLRLERHLKLEDVSWSYEVTTSALIPELLQNAAFSDLVVMGREPHFHEFSRTGPSLLGEIICTARTPICIPGDEVKTFDPFGNALIAWNGSIEAANAVRAAVGLLKMAADVRIVRFREEKDVAFPDSRLLEYLSRHGISAVLDERVVGIGFADDLIEYAGLFATDYIVMGGYSHSRAGEFLFGGVTRALLGACGVTLVMAH